MQRRDDTVQNILAKLKIGVLGIPFDVGWTGEGIAEAPEAVRRAGLVKELSATGREVFDLGDAMSPT